MTPANLKTRGRCLRSDARRDLRGEVVVDGVKPKKGMWIVHRGRGRVYGRILRVWRSGVVVWVGEAGTPIATDGRTLVDGGYSYVQHARVWWERERASTCITES
jgi:hypothetical protein